MLRSSGGQVLRSLVAALCAVSATVSSAAGDYIVLGAGTRNCEAFLESYKAEGWQRIMDSVWVSGYLSAVNEHMALGSNVSATMTAPERERWLADYCQANTGDTLHNAASSLLQYLLSNRDNPH